MGPSNDIRQARRILVALLVLTLASCAKSDNNSSSKLIKDIENNPEMYLEQLTKSADRSRKQLPESTIEHIFVLNNLAYVHRVHGDTEKANSVRVEAARVWPRSEEGQITDERASSGAGFTLFSAPSGQDVPPGFDPSICSVFVGGTGPFNPDPETGGDLAICAQIDSFGDMTIYDPCGFFGYDSCPGGSGGGGSGGGSGGGGSGGGGSGSGWPLEPPDTDLESCIASGEGIPVTGEFCDSKQCNCCLEEANGNFDCVQCKRDPGSTALSNGDCDHFGVKPNKLKLKPKK
jgi:hypothetical protein